MLQNHYYEGKVEAGCDEAGRGCLAGSVFAAAVIFPPDYQNELLNDSKQLTEKRRYQLREIDQHPQCLHPRHASRTGSVDGTP